MVPLTSEEIDEIQRLSDSGASVPEFSRCIQRLLVERVYLISALHSTASGSQAMTEFLLHLERYELLREENEMLKKQLACSGPIAMAV